MVAGSGASYLAGAVAARVRIVPKGPQPKHPDKRQRRNRTPTVGVTNPVPPPQLVVVDAPLHPPVPEGLLDEIAAGWDEYWSSDVARAVSIEDLPALTRLFRLRNEWETIRVLVEKSGELIRGSMKQLVLNPLYKRMDATGAEIRQLEDRYGMNPMSRARLAVSLGDIQRTVEDLSRELREGSTGGDSDPLQIVDVSDSDA